MKKGYLLVGVLFVFLVVSAAFTTAFPFVEKVTSEEVVRTMTIDETATMDVDSDTAIIRFTVETEGKESKVAQNQNSEKVDAVIKALKNLGLKDDELQTSNYNIYPNRNYNRGTPRYGEIVSYTVTHTIVVETKKLDKVGDILDKGVEAGANRIDSFDFTLSREAKDELIGDLLAEAAKSARVKADSLAEALDTKVVAVHQVNVGNSYTPVYRGYNMATTYDAEMDEAFASTKVIPGDVSLSASVSVTFQIE